MEILIKSARILDPASSFNQQVKDILILDGKITNIADSIPSLPSYQVIERDGLHVSIGWTDLKADFCDPGHEHKEDLISGLNTAAAGGFTHVVSIPARTPVTDGKTQIEYLLSKANHKATQLHPAGAISKNLEGKDLAEMYDMYQSGARIFSDDLNSLSAGMAYRALLYAKNFGARVTLFNRDSSISGGGQVNEGMASLKTGLKADPEIAELIQLERNLRLLAYTESKLHITGVSCEAAIELIRAAKADGLDLTADVHVEQLLFTEENCLDFDQHYKLLPVLRREQDRKALVEAVRSGIIDAVVSNHRPADQEDKEVEFDLAQFGNTNLQTMFSSILQKGELTLHEWVDILARRNRNLLEIAETRIEVGTNADLTLFCPNETWTTTAENWQSKSKYSPFYGKEMVGRVVGIVNNRKFAVLL